MAKNISGLLGINKMKNTALFTFALMALTCVANAQPNEFGPDAGNGTMTGVGNTANGWCALFSNTSGGLNTANGTSALFFNTTGSGNVANGPQALLYNTTGNVNTANGASALYSNTTGYGNVANGICALFLNTTGNNNMANGSSALGSNTTGSNNIGLGNEAGYYLTNGDNNIDIGNEGIAAESGTIRIGTTGTHTNTFIAGISGVTVPNAAKPVVVDSVSGQLGTVDISTLVGPTGATGAQGPAGISGVNGIGFVPGAYLYLPSTTAAPTGFTKIGTKTDLITDLHGHTKTLKINVYQKN